MKYVELFRLALEHDYYPDRRCLDFQIEVGSETQKFIKDFRAKLQPLPGEVRVLIPTDNDKTPFILLPSTSVLTFQLHLDNPDFSLFTDMSELNKYTAPCYVNLKTKKQGALKLGSRKPITYPARSILRPGVFADIEINLDTHSPKLPTKTYDYQVVFKSRQVRWKYYVIVNKSDTQTVLPTLKDKDEKILFSDTDRTDLTQAPDVTDEIALGLANQYPNRQIFRFTSSTPIPSQKAVKNNIQLYLDGNKVLNTLPNPLLQNYTFDASNGKKEFALYHVVKYFTP